MTSSASWGGISSNPLRTPLKVALLHEIAPDDIHVAQRLLL